MPGRRLTGGDGSGEGAAGAQLLQHRRDRTPTERQWRLERSPPGRWTHKYAAPPLVQGELREPRRDAVKGQERLRRGPRPEPRRQLGAADGRAGASTPDEQRKSGLGRARVDGARPRAPSRCRASMTPSAGRSQAASAAPPPAAGYTSRSPARHSTSRGPMTISTCRHTPHPGAEAAGAQAAGARRSAAEKPESQPQSTGKRHVRPPVATLKQEMYHPLGDTRKEKAAPVSHAPHHPWAPPAAAGEPKDARAQRSPIVVPAGQAAATRPARSSATFSTLREAPVVVAHTAARASPAGGYGGAALVSHMSGPE